MTSALVSSDHVVHEQLDKLLDKGLFKTAYYSAVNLWGSHQKWHATEQLLVLKRIFRGLGNYRAASFIDIKLFRQEPSKSKFALNHFLHFSNRKGAIENFDMVESWLEKVSDDPAETANWLVAKAMILMRVRDFTSAHELLDQVKDVEPVRRWADIMRLRLLEEEGRREEAVSLAEQYYRNNKCVRLLEFYVSLIRVLDGVEQAKAILLKDIGDFESVSLWQLAARYHYEMSEFEPAQRCLAQAEELQIFGQEKDDTYSYWLKSQLFLEQRNLAEAKQELAQLKDSFSVSVLNRLNQVDRLSPIIKLDVPHITQKNMTCAPSSLAAVARYWGQEADEDDIAQKICFQGTADNLQRDWLSEHGFVYLDFDLDLDAAVELLERGIPFTLVTTQGMTSHLQVVKGIDKDAGYLYLMDPSVSMESKLLLEETCQYDAVTGPHCRAIVPYQQAKKLDNLSLPAQHLYPLRQELEQKLDVQGITQCRQIVAKMEHIDPKHRITLFAKRSLAIELNDEAAIEASTSRLLAKYPNTTFLVLSKYASLKVLKGHAKAYQWLREQYKSFKTLDVFNKLLQDINVSEQESASKQKFINDAVVWTSAEYFWLQAHSLWQQGDKLKAAMLYYWSVCLEPSQDAYLRSFYIAYRDQGRSVEAIEKLKQLYDTSINVSPQMAYSLYRAYCMDGKEHTGLDKLANACQKHHHNAALIGFYLGELSTNGQWERFEREYQVYSAQLTDVERLNVASQKALDKGDNFAAIKGYEALLCILPGSNEARYNLVDAYNRAGLNANAEEFLSQLQEQYGESLTVLRLIADKSKNQPRVLIALEKIRSLYPLEFDSIRQLAYIYLYNDQVEDAQAITSILLNKEYNCADNLVLAAEVGLKNNQWSQAKSYAKEAITISPNSSSAFDTLMRAYTSPVEKKRVLAEYADQLRSIANAEDGLWNFWHTARYWFDAEELRKFCDDMLDNHGLKWCSWVISAYQRELAGNLEQAIQDLDHAAKISPLVARIFLEKARLLSYLDRHSKAEENFEYAISLAPGWETLAIEYYNFLERTSQMKKGLAVLERCKTFNDNGATLLGYIADCYRAFERDERSLSLFIEAVTRRFNYPWAWYQLKLLSEKLDNGEVWQKMIAERQENYSSSVDTWLITASLSDELEDKCASLKRAQLLEPTHLDVCIELADTYLAMERYQEVFELISDAVWDGSAPITLRLREPQAMFRAGQYEQALIVLKGLLTHNSTFILAWQLKIQCEVKLGKAELALKSAEALEAIAGRDATALYDVIRTYDAYGQARHKDKILELYQYAYNIAPTEAELAFSYLDKLIEQEQLEAASVLAKNMENNFALPWINVRVLEISARQRAFDKAESLYRDILNSGENTAWLYDYPMHFAVSNNFTELTNAMYGTLESYIRQQEVNEAVAGTYAKCFLDRNGEKAVRSLLEQDLQCHVWDAVCDVYFSICADNNVSPKPEFWRQYDQRILQNDWLAGQKGYVLLRSSYYYEARDHYVKMGVLQREDLSTYILYHCAIITSEIKDYELFQQVMDLFLTRRKDNCYNNGLVWYCFNQLLKGQAPDVELLQSIDKSDITEMEKNMIELMQVACRFKQVQDNNEEFNFAEVTKVSRQFSFVGHVVNDVNKAMINYLVSNYQGSSLAKFWLKTKLHFKFR